MKVTINLPESALKLADEGAARLCISRSAFISVAIAEKVKQDSVMESMPLLLSELQDMKAALAAASASGDVQEDAAPILT